MNSVLYSKFYDLALKDFHPNNCELNNSSISNEAPDIVRSKMTNRLANHSFVEICGGRKELKGNKHQHIKVHSEQIFS